MVHEMRLMRPFNHKTGKKMFGKITVRIEDDAHDSTGANGLFCCFPLVSKSVYPRGWLAACMWSNITLWRQITVNYQTLLPVRGIAFRLVNVIWRLLYVQTEKPVEFTAVAVAYHSTAKWLAPWLRCLPATGRPGQEGMSDQCSMWCDVMGARTTIAIHQACRKCHRWKLFLILPWSTQLKIHFLGNSKFNCPCLHVADELSRIPL